MGSRLTRDLGPRIGLEVDRFADDCLEDLLLVVAVEWREATKQDIQHDATAPDVGLFAVRTTEDLLRGVRAWGGGGDECLDS